MSDQRNNQISKTQVMALAEALEAVETYVPTTWVDNTEPDIDAEHLNHAEQGIKRVTDALNGAVSTINNLSAQLANYIPVSKIVDNLLSTDAETVLSGKMGKQLSDLITENSNAISTLNSKCQKTAEFCGMNFIGKEVLTAGETGIDNVKNTFFPNTPYPITYMFVGSNGWLYWGAERNDTNGVQFCSQTWNKHLAKRCKFGTTSWREWDVIISP